MIKLNRTNFTSVKECFFPDNGEAITLPQGFGINNPIEDLNKRTKIQCPIFSCMLKDTSYNMFNKNGTVNKQSFKLYEKYLFVISSIFSLYIYNRSNNTTEIQKTEPKANSTSYKGTDVLDGETPPTIFFNMNSESSTGLISNTLGMSKSNIIQMVNFLIKYKFLELYSEQKSYVNYSKGETIADKRCRHFLVSEQLFRTPKKYFFKIKKNVESFQKKIEKELQDLFDNAEDQAVNFETKLLSDRMIQSYTFPTTERLQEVAVKMVKNKEKDKYGRIYSDGIPQEWMSDDNGKTVTKKKANGETFTYTIRGKLKEGCPFVDINIHLYNYTITLNGSKKVKARKRYNNGRETYYDRFYCFLSNIPKWIRQEILIDGDKIVEIDATALHSRIVGKLYSDYAKVEIPEFLTGDSHTKVAELLGISRPEAKILALSYWNSRILNGSTIGSKKNIEKFGKMDDFLMKDYHKFFRYLDRVKSGKAIKIGKSAHSNMSVLLIDKEVRIMQEFIETYNESVGSLLYVYDAVYVKESVYEIARKGFENIINKYLEI